MRPSFVFVAALLVACPKRHDDDAVRAQEQALAAADRLWSDRDRAGLDAVSQALDKAPVPSDPEVIWRRTRVGVARGLVATDVPTQRRALADARGRSMDCLVAVSAVRRQLADGDVEAAMLEVPEDRRRCALWAGYAWTRWLGTWSVGAAAVDAPVVRGLLARGGREVVGQEAELQRWSVALLDAALGGDGRSLLVVPRRDDDDAWVWWADVMRWTPEHDLKPPARGPSTPEERVAYARLVEADETDER